MQAISPPPPPFSLPSLLLLLPLIPSPLYNIMESDSSSHNLHQPLKQAGNKSSSSFLYSSSSLLPLLLPLLPSPLYNIITSDISCQDLDQPLKQVRNTESHGADITQVVGEALPHHCLYITSNIVPHLRVP